MVSTSGPRNSGSCRRKAIKMFYVWENGKLCVASNFEDMRVNYGWDNAEFDNFEAAKDYAMKWLGEYAPDREQFQINEPYEYSGYGDYITITDAPNAPWEMLFNEANKLNWGKVQDIVMAAVERQNVNVNA